MTLGATIESGNVLSVYLCSVCLNTHIEMLSHYPGMLDFCGPCICTMLSMQLSFQAMARQSHTILFVCCAFALDIASQSGAFT